MNKIVIATTTFYSEMNIRAELAIQTIKKAGESGYPIVVIDGGSLPEFRDKIGTLGAIALAESQQGMGPSRRQAKREASKIAGEDGVVVWMEPEKLSFISEIQKTAQPIIDGLADLVVPERESLATYPPEQQYAERLGNLVFFYLTNLKLDVWFGPKVMNQRALKIFLDYNGEYGDTWESIMVPVAQCIAGDLKVTGCPVTYMHPSEQTVQETGDVKTCLRRIEQLQKIVLSLIKTTESM